MVLCVWGYIIYIAFTLIFYFGGAESPIIPSHWGWLIPIAIPYAIFCAIAVHVLGFAIGIITWVLDATRISYFLDTVVFNLFEHGAKKEKALREINRIYRNLSSAYDNLHRQSSRFYVEPYKIDNKYLRDDYYEGNNIGHVNSLAQVLESENRKFKNEIDIIKPHLDSVLNFCPTLNFTNHKQGENFFKSILTTYQGYEELQEEFLKALTVRFQIQQGYEYRNVV
jgi:hypothetical protein